MGALRAHALAVVKFATRTGQDRGGLGVGAGGAAVVSCSSDPALHPRHRVDLSWAATIVPWQPSPAS
jgi:hypothetical protein